MQDDRIERAAGVDVPVVQTLGQQGVVGLEVGIVRILVPARYREVQPEQRAQRSAVERVRIDLDVFPGANGPGTERAELKRPLQPVLETTLAVLGAHPDGVARLAIDSLVVANAVALQAQVVHLGSSYQAVYRFTRRGVDAPERLSLVPSVVEDAS